MYTTPHLKNPYAELDKADSGNLITPAQAKDLSTDKFFCPFEDCKDPDRKLFLTHKGDLYFFSHYADYEHEISPETLLHKLTIQKFVGLPIFQIPSFTDKLNNFYSVQILNLDPSKTEVEYSILTGIRPDVLIVTDKGLKIAVEIFVTHDVDEKKRKKIEVYNLPTIELNLSNFYKENRERCKTDIAFINRNAEKLIRDIKLKSWIVNPLHEQVNGMLENKPGTAINPEIQKGDVKPKDDSCAKLICGLIIAAILLFFAFVFGNGSDKSKKKK